MGRAGNFLKHPEGYFYFIPKPLPPDPPIRRDLEFETLCDEANRSLGRLDALSELLPDLKVFSTMFLRKEAVLSSQIEGTQATLVDLLEAESEDESPSSGPVLELMNYVKAIDHGLNLLEELPVCLRLIRETHRVLLQGVRGASRNPGEFRTTQNFIGAPGSQIQDAEFVPPPVSQMQEALANLEEFYHHGQETALVKCGLIHAQFQTIHPFLDGNGRIGRLLITLFLCEHKILTKPLLYMSYFFNQNKAEYYDRLMAIRTKGDWEGWLKFFFRGIREVSSRAVTTAKEIRSLRERDWSLIQRETGSPNASKLHELLFQQPVIKVASVQKSLEVSYLTAYNLVRRFVEMGILQKLPHRKRNIMFSYRDYLTVLQEGSAVPQHSMVSGRDARTFVKS